MNGMVKDWVLASWQRQSVRQCGASWIEPERLQWMVAEAWFVDELEKQVRWAS